MEVPFPPIPPDAAGVTLIVIDSGARAYSQIMQNPLSGARRVFLIGSWGRTFSALPVDLCTAPRSVEGMGRATRGTAASELAALDGT